MSLITWWQIIVVEEEKAMSRSEQIISSPGEYYTRIKLTDSDRLRKKTVKLNRMVLKEAKLNEELVRLVGRNK